MGNRGVKLPRVEVIARVLAKAKQKPGLSPSRLCSYSSVNYYNFKAIVEAGSYAWKKLGVIAAL
jgi:hypothetical protein